MTLTMRAGLLTPDLAGLGNGVNGTTDGWDAKPVRGPREAGSYWRTICFKAEA